MEEFQSRRRWVDVFKFDVRPCRRNGIFADDQFGCILILFVIVVDPYQNIIRRRHIHSHHRIPSHSQSGRRCSSKDGRDLTGRSYQMILGLVPLVLHDSRADGNPDDGDNRQKLN